MDITHCPHCHERLIPPVVPAGCVCDPREWRNPDAIPEACSRFIADKLGACSVCEHDEACHVPRSESDDP